MASLLLRDVPMPLLARLRERAAADHRTLDGQVIWLLQESIQDPESASATPSCDRTAQLAAWHAFAGQWRGSPQETDAVIADIYDARTVGQEIEETGQASTAADRSLQGD